MTMDMELILGLLSGLSVIMFAASLIGIPWIVSRLPADYFVRDRMQRRLRLTHYRRLMLTAVRNVLGLILVAAGIGMLFLPGQGILTMVLGVAMTDFPGKERLERLMLRSARLKKSLNWIRKKRGAQAFRFPE